MGGGSVVHGCIFYTKYKTKENVIEFNIYNIFIEHLFNRAELYGGTAFWAAVGNPTHSD